MLLSELKKATPKDEPSYEGISSALDKIINVADQINQSLHQKEAVEKGQFGSSSALGLFVRSPRFVWLA
jgi:hypothetical protein